MIIRSLFILLILISLAVVLLTEIFGKPKTVEKVIYQDKLVEKVIYKDKPVEVVKEKIVYQEKIVEKIIKIQPKERSCVTKIHKLAVPAGGSTSITTCTEWKSGDYKPTPKKIKRLPKPADPTRNKISATNKKIKHIVSREINKLGDKANLNHIDTSAVTNMSNLFAKRSMRDFNGDISKWDVSNVKNMKHMFHRSKFNGDISEWNVSNVRNMNGMFRGRKGDNTPFNQFISHWELDSLTHAKEMFKHSNFNQDISKWSPERLKNTKEMFRFSAFDGDLSAWRFPNITNIEGMFWDSKFDCKTIPATWKTYPVKNGSFTSCGVSDIESHLNSVNTLLWIVFTALWGVFLLIGPLIFKMDKNRKLENKHKNTNLEHLNMSLKQSIGIINMIFLKIHQEESSKVFTKNSEIIEQTLNKMSVISSRVISSTYCNTRISELFHNIALRSKISGNLNEFIKDNKDLELQLKDSALEAVNIVLDSMTNPTDTSNNLKINIKKVWLNNFKNPINPIFFKKAIEIKISNTGLNNIDVYNQHTEELMLAKEFVELQHYGKFKTNKTGSEVVITLPIKKIEHY